MIIELITAVSIVKGTIEFFNKDFYVQKNYMNHNFDCTWEYGKRTTITDPTLFKLTDPNGQDYVMWKQQCEEKENE